jgi:hypothetical protein
MWWRAKRPPIYLHKHRDTRRYLNIDEDGNAYTYLPPRNPDSVARGRYTPHASLVAGVDALHLYELPWMQEELADERHNLPWKQDEIERRALLVLDRVKADGRACRQRGTG